jgi:hypothetical protein
MAGGKMKTCQKGHPPYDDSRRKCSICQKEYLREYHQKNKERARQNNKAWEAKNRERHEEYHRQYRKDHHEKRLKYMRDWYEGHPSFLPWRGMLIRCLDPRSKAWNHYGGRGIKVCERWQGENGFENFKADMGPRPSRKHSIDRFPDNDGNYEPGNTRWATAKQQGRNRRDNVKITIGDRTMCISEWAEEAGLSIMTVWQRVQKGWTGERLLSPPLRKSDSGNLFGDP